MEAGDREAAIAEVVTGVCDLKSNALCVVGKSLIIVLGWLRNILSEGEKLLSDSHRVSFYALMHEKAPLLLT